MRISEVPIVGGLARSAYGSLPRRRRLRGLEGFSPKRLLQLRRSIPGADRIPITVSSPEGLRLRFTADPLDETIAEDVFGRHREIYFPSGLWDPSVEVVLDLGAHHGQFTLLASQLAPDARIIAVEPGPSQAVALRTNVELNRLGDRVDVVQAALGDRCGSATLHLDGSGSWGNTLFSPQLDGGSVSVRVATLSAICDGTLPNVIKCNAEGAEYALVDQLSALDQLPQLIILMVHDEHGDPQELADQIGKLGYFIDRYLVGDHQTWHCSRATP